jgi:hypothetical protein
VSAFLDGFVDELIKLGQSRVEPGETKETSKETYSPPPQSPVKEKIVEEPGATTTVKTYPKGKFTLIQGPQRSWQSSVKPSRQRSYEPPKAGETKPL